MSIAHIGPGYKKNLKKKISVILLHGCFTAHYRRIQTIDNLITKDIKTSSSRRARVYEDSPNQRK